MEVEFKAEHYLHFTGVKTNVAPKFFYKMCVNRRLSFRDFSVPDDGIVDLKLKVLPKLMKENISANMVGEYNGNRPVLYTERLAGNISACMGFVKHSENNMVTCKTKIPFVKQNSRNQLKKDICIARFPICKANSRFVNEIP